MRTVGKVGYMTHAVLVYQAGIANVFSLSSSDTTPATRHAKRLVQSDFRTCESFAQGLAAAGVNVTTMHCNQAGDIINSLWSIELEEAPFRESFRPVFHVAMEVR